MSSKNLAKFTKTRPSLKVVGTPQLNATRASDYVSQSDRQSIFSQQSNMKRRQLDADQRSNATSYRLRKPVNAEQHKKRIFEVVNNLNEEELEKISEMLKVSEALDGKEPLGEEGERDGEVCFDEDVDGNEAEQ